MRLSGKVTVVTGAAVGLGRAIAARFAHEGAVVIAADTNESDGESVIEGLKREGCTATFVRTDVSDEASVKLLFDKIQSEFERVDVLYNNAAVLLYERDLPVHELSVDVWDYVMKINLRGAFLCTKYAIPYMLKYGSGSIVNLGSPTGMRGCAPKLTAYGTSKAAIIGLTRAAAAAYGQQHIRVNSIVPGTMDTPMNRVLLNDRAISNQFKNAVPLGRLGVPQDIEGLAVFLASDESAYCTGGLYMCDGGLTAV